MAESQIGVLIDYENVGLGSIHSLFDQLSDVGRIIIKRAYADWSRAAVKGEQMLELGIEARQHFHPAGSGKNASDILLTIDAVDLLHRSSLDTFVIVSSDTDFVPLVNALRAAGKTVIGAGRRGIVSPGLVRSCDRYIYLEEGNSTAQAQAQSGLEEQAESLLVRAVSASTDDLGQVGGAKLHNTIRRMDPSFDYRALGHRSFTQFLASSHRVKLQRPRGHGDVLVELAAGQMRSTPLAGQPVGQMQGTPLAEQPAGQMRSTPLAEEPAGPDSWDSAVDAAWSEVPGNLLAGSKAAAEAAKVLGASKLSASRYKSLQGLLDVSELLRSRWSREGNAIRRRTT